MAQDINNVIEYETSLYTYMKRFFSTEYKLKSRELTDLNDIIISSLRKNLNYEDIKQNLISYLNKHISKISKAEEYERLLLLWNDEIYPYLFLSAIHLINYKNSLCSLINQAVDDTSSIERPLTLKHDNITVNSVYMKRAITNRYIDIYLADLYNSNIEFQYVIDTLVNKSIEVRNAYYPIIHESLKQSATSQGGANYEDHIYNYLIEIGLNSSTNNIQRFNHEEIGSLENDFKFIYNNRKFGISAKKTFRERYKQYVNLTEKETDLDVFLTITLGTDLTKDKAETIRGFGVYIFVSPEVYTNCRYLQNMDGVYSIFDLNLNLLDTLR